MSVTWRNSASFWKLPIGFLAMLFLPQALYAQDAFEDFKNAIAAGNAAYAMAAMTASRDVALAEKMEAYALAQCDKKNQTACFVVHCKAGFNPELYFTKRCADAMGRSYGDGWMEAERRQRGNQVEYSFKCSNGKAYYYAWCEAPGAPCRLGLPLNRPVDYEGRAFRSLDEAARYECSRIPSKKK